MSRTTIATQAFGPETSMRREARRQILSALLGSLAGLVTRAIAAYAERRRVTRAIAELKSLNDRMLRDMGVERHDIERIVRYGRDATETRK